MRARESIDRRTLLSYRDGHQGHNGMIRIMNVFGERYSRPWKLSNEEFHIPSSFTFVPIHTGNTQILASSSAAASSPFLVELTGVVTIVRLDDACAKHPLEAREPILCSFFPDVAARVT